MTGLHDTDIRLNDEWALTQAADGDAPLCSGLECLYQNIILEALTQPGDLFYDASFGWGLYDFIQSISIHAPRAGSDELGSVGCAVVRLNISLEGRVVRPGAVPQDALDRHLLGALVARALCHHARHGRVAFAVLHDVLFASL